MYDPYSYSFVFEVICIIIRLLWNNLEPKIKGAWIFCVASYAGTAVGLEILTIFWNTQQRKARVFDSDKNNSIVRPLSYQ